MNTVVNVSAAATTIAVAGDWMMTAGLKKMWRRSDQQLIGGSMVAVVIVRLLGLTPNKSKAV